MVFVGLHRLGADRETHSRPWSETYRVVARMAGGAQFWRVRIFLLQQLAETIEIDPPDVFIKS